MANCIHIDKCISRPVMISTAFTLCSDAPACQPIKPDRDGAVHNWHMDRLQCVIDPAVIMLYQVTIHALIDHSILLARLFILGLVRSRETEQMARFLESATSKMLVANLQGLPASP